MIFADVPCIYSHEVLIWVVLRESRLTLLRILCELRQLEILFVNFNKILFFNFILHLILYNLCLLLLDHAAQSSYEVSSTLFYRRSDVSGLFLDLVLFGLVLGVGGSTSSSIFDWLLDGSGSLTDPVLLSLFLHEVSSFGDGVSQAHVVRGNLDLGSTETKELLALADKAGTFWNVGTTTSVQVRLLILKV